MTLRDLESASHSRCPPSINCWRDYQSVNTNVLAKPWNCGCLGSFEIPQLARMLFQLPPPEPVERRAQEDDSDADKSLLRTGHDRVQRPRSCHQEIHRWQ